MPKKAAELGALATSRLSASGLHFVGGVSGLALQVLPSGGRSWILRIRIAGKRRDMGLGGYPDVPLADARDAARAARAKVRAGIDPIEEQRQAREMLRLAQSNAITFQRATESYIETHSPAWTNAKHAQQWTNSLTTHAYPHIGHVLVRDITLQHVLNVLEPIWRTKTETATRVRARVESILDWATTKGYRDGLNPARWRGHLSNLLPAPAKIKKGEHQPALPIREVGAFMQELRQMDGMGARALEFCILAASRSAEVRGAVWGEIDIDAAEWTIPSERMKAKVPHRVPLSTPALELLRTLHDAATGGDERSCLDRAALVFPAPRGGEMSDSTLNAVIGRMNAGETPRWADSKSGRQVVQHGFRSTFRDWASERTNYPRDVAEMALAHTIGDKVEAAYRRGDLFQKRRRMMEDWATYLSKPEKAAKVVPMEAGLARA